VVAPVGGERAFKESYDGVLGEEALLREARALRIYPGLRPLTPDHVPIVGPFAEGPNLCVATGHEGAGIGLAPATAELVAAGHTVAPSPLPPAWFSPDRSAPVVLAAS
jgi:glycine/D-amino acid oxidase-like deaminating enzyme